MELYLCSCSTGECADITNMLAPDGLKSISNRWRRQINRIMGRPRYVFLTAIRVNAGC
jgi:hypothetical protein